MAKSIHKMPANLSGKSACPTRLILVVEKEKGERGGRYTLPAVVNGVPAPRGCYINHSTVLYNLVICSC